MKALILAALAIGTPAMMLAQASAEPPTVADSSSVATLYSSLPEVMVGGQQPIAKLEKSSLTFNMPLLLQQLPADNAYEALGRIPGITATDEGVSFGAQPITLIVNGKSTTLSEEQVRERLKQMPAEQLAKAELMMSAPARYHVRGAVINVVTKGHDGTNHTSGQLQATYQQNRYALGTLRGNLLHTQGKLSIDATYRYVAGRMFGDSEDEALHPLESGPVEYRAKRESRSRHIAHNYRLGIDYQFAKDHALSAAYTGKWSSYRNYNTTTGSSVSTNNSQGHDYLHNIDMDYTAPFGLHLTASYTYYKTPESQLLNGTIVDSRRDLEANSRQTINQWLVAADQTHSLPHQWELNYGAQARWANNNTYQTTVDADGNTLAEGTNSVDIDERIVSAYAGFSKPLGQAVNLSAQIEVENYHTPRWNEWSLYPALNLSWMASPSHMLNLSLSSNSDYPTYWETMNNVFYSSAYNEIWGNPNLKPAREYNLSLMWQIKSRYTIVAFAGTTSNYFKQQPFQPADRMAVVMRQDNWDYHRTAGLQAMAQYSIGQWLHGSAFAMGLYVHDKLQDTDYIPFNRKKLTAIAGTTANISLSRQLSLMVNPFIQTPAIQGIMDIGTIFTLNASLRWTSANGNWNVTAKGNNLTNRHFTTKAYENGLNYSFSVCQDWINCELTLTYKFGNYKEKRVKEVDTSRMGR